MDYLTLFETQEILQGSLEDCEVTLHRVFMKMIVINHLYQNLKKKIRMATGGVTK